MFGMVLAVFLIAIAVYAILIFSYRGCDKNATMLFSIGFMLNVTYLINFLLTKDVIIAYFVFLTAVFMIIAYHLIKVKK